MKEASTWDEARIQQTGYIYRLLEYQTSTTYIMEMNYHSIVRYMEQVQCEMSFIKIGQVSQLDMYL